MNIKRIEAGQAQATIYPESNEIRVTATVPGADVTLAPASDDTDRTTRPATIGGEQVELEVLHGAPPPGTELKGPAAIDLPESTLIVPAQWSGEVDDAGTIHLKKSTA